VTSSAAALNSAGFAMANSRTGMAATLAVAGCSRRVAIVLYGFHDKDRPVRLTTLRLACSAVSPPVC
jgi:hypothetical protein